MTKPALAREVEALRAEVGRLREAAQSAVDAYDAGGERPSVVDQDGLQHAMSELRDALGPSPGKEEEGR